MNNNGVTFFFLLLLLLFYSFPPQTKKERKSDPLFFRGERIEKRIFLLILPILWNPLQHSFFFGGMREGGGIVRVPSVGSKNSVKKNKLGNDIDRSRTTPVFVGNRRMM